MRYAAHAKRVDKYRIKEVLDDRDSKIFFVCEKKKKNRVVISWCGDGKWRRMVAISVRHTRTGAVGLPQRISGSMHPCNICGRV